MRDITIHSSDNLMQYADCFMSYPVTPVLHVIQTAIHCLSLSFLLLVSTKIIGLLVRIIVIFCKRTHETKFNLQRFQTSIKSKYNSCVFF